MTKEEKEVFDLALKNGWHLPPGGFIQEPTHRCHTLVSDDVVFCDVDETLISYDYSDFEDELIKIIDPYDKEELELFPLKANIRLLKRCKLKGKSVVVWSRGGYKWAEAVVEALNLQEYVDLIMAKVELYIDDKDISDWGTSRSYLKNYGGY